MSNNPFEDIEKNRTAHREGINSYHAGFTLTDCKHRKGTIKYEQWMQGWHDAENGEDKPL